MRVYVDFIFVYLWPARKTLLNRNYGNLLEINAARLRFIIFIFFFSVVVISKIM